MRPEATANFAHRTFGVPNLVRGLRPSGRSHGQNSKHCAPSRRFRAASLREAPRLLESLAQNRSVEWSTQNHASRTTFPGFEQVTHLRVVKFLRISTQASHWNCCKSSLSSTESSWIRMSHGFSSFQAVGSSASSSEASQPFRSCAVMGIPKIRCWSSKASTFLCKASSRSAETRLEPFVLLVLLALGALGRGEALGRRNAELHRSKQKHTPAQDWGEPKWNNPPKKKTTFSTKFTFSAKMVKTGAAKVKEKKKKRRKAASSTQPHPPFSPRASSRASAPPAPRPTAPARPAAAGC